MADAIEQEKPDPQKVANEIAVAADADVLLWNGPVERNWDRRLIRTCEHKRRRPNVLLILVTGDADAAYRMGRCLQTHYTKFVCFVSGYCKSAGTLIVLGAHELIFSDHGEIGPIDVQMSKKDEIWEMESGLTLISAMTTLQEKAFSAFEHFFTLTKLRSGGTITLKTATDIAAKLTTGIFSPIYDQIDPMHVGEAGRALTVATEYGSRLVRISKNPKPDALERLVSGYPSHGFVIDRSEAEDLFSHIRKPTTKEAQLATDLGWKSTMAGSGKPVIEFLSDELKEEGSAKESNNAAVEGRAEPNVAAVAAAAGGPIPSDGEPRA